MFETGGGKHGPIVNCRSDIWRHMRGPGRFTLGCRWRWSIGPDFFEAIRRYYLDLLQAGVIRKKVNSTQKNSVLLSPQFRLGVRRSPAVTNGGNLTNLSWSQFTRG